MKIRSITSSLLFGFTLLISCDSSDIKTEIPPIKERFDFFTQKFTDLPISVGTNEIPIDLSNWKNYNTSNTRKWICKEATTVNGVKNKYAEFSSFFSGNTTKDESWLIITNQDFTKIKSKYLTFRIGSAFTNGASLKLLVSTNYDGTQAGLANASWIEKQFNIPTSNVSLTDGDKSPRYINLNEFESANVSIAFKYEGSKQSGKTTTFQIDDVALYESK